jgi:RimJ/RimL family protein N-acetyltransferase
MEVTLDRVSRVEIHCDPANVRSATVPREFGYTHEVTRRQDARLPDGRFRDTMIWTLLVGEYPGSPSAQAEVEAFDVMGRRILL